MVSISCNFLVSVVNVGSGLSVGFESGRVQNSRVLVGSGLKLFTVGRVEFSSKLQPSTMHQPLMDRFRFI